MISTLKQLGYFLAATLVFIILVVGAITIAALAAGLWVLGLAAAAVLFIAYCIKEYFEQPVSNRKDEGS